MTRGPGPLCAAVITPVPAGVGPTCSSVGMAQKALTPVRAGKVNLTGTVPLEVAERVHGTARARGWSVSAVVAEALTEQFTDPKPTASASTDRSPSERNHP